MIPKVGSGGLPNMINQCTSKQHNSRTKYDCVIFLYEAVFRTSYELGHPPWTDYEECKGRVHSRAAQVPSIDCGNPLSLVLL